MSKKRKNKRIKSSLVVGLPVKKMDFGTPEFRAKVKIDKVKTDKGKTGKVRDQRAIGKYHRLYCIDQEKNVAEENRRGINHDQYTAADRLMCNYERTFPRTGKTLSPDYVPGVGPSPSDLLPIEKCMQAVHNHERVISQLGKVSRKIIEHVCCDEKSLTDFEKQERWRKGYGMQRFREALDELAEIYRNRTRR